MRAGTLRQRVELQHYLVKRNEYNEEIKDWQRLAIVWAAVEPMNGNEQFAGGQIAGSTTVRIRIRWQEGLLVALDQRIRAIHENRTYDVQQVIRVHERHREIHLICLHRDQTDEGWRG